MQALHALDGDDLRTHAGDARAHRVQQGSQRLHLGLRGGVDDGRFASGEGGRQHEVLGTGNRGVVGKDARAREALGGAGLVVLTDAVDGGAHGFEAVEVDGDGALADDIAAGGREGGKTVAGEQGAHHLEGGAVLGDKADGGLKGPHLRCVDLDTVRVGTLDGRAEVREQVGEGVDVGNGGDVLEDDGLIGKESGAHGGEGGIRGAGDSHGTLEDSATPHLVAGAVSTFRDHPEAQYGGGAKAAAN